MVSTVQGQDAPVTRLMDYWLRPETERSAGVDFDLEVTVLYYDADWKVLVVQDESGTNYLGGEGRLPISRGQRVRLSGRTRPSSNAFVIEAPKVEVLGLGEMRFKPFDFRMAKVMAPAELAVEGIGLVEHQVLNDETHLRLEMVMNGSPVGVWVHFDADEPVPAYAGMMVRVQGAYAGQVKDPSDVNQCYIFSPGLDRVVPLARLEDWSNFQGEVVSTSSLRQRAGQEWVKVAGRVVAVNRDENWMTVRDAEGEVTVRTGQRVTPMADRWVEAVGTPVVTGVELNLTMALVRIIEDKSAERVEGEGSLVRRLHRIASTVLELGADQASRSHPVKLEGVVTWSDPESLLFYLQDSSGGIGVYRPSAGMKAPEPGSHIVLEGVTVMSDFAPRVQATHLTRLGVLPYPRPRRVVTDQALRGGEEAQWVEVSGLVNKVTRGTPWAKVSFSTLVGSLVARVEDRDGLEELVGAVVSVFGVSNAIADEDRRLMGVELWVPRGSTVTVLDEGGASAFSSPLQSLGSVGRFNPMSDQRRRIRISGTVLHWDEQGRVFLEDQGAGLLVLSTLPRPAESYLGWRVEAAGLSGRRAGRPVLRDALIRKVGEGEQPKAQRLTNWNELRPDLDGKRITTEARLEHIYQVGGGSRFSFWADGVVFQAEFAGALGDQAVPAPGSRVRLDGVYVLDRDEWSQPVGFRVLLGDVSQFAVVQPPPSWTLARWRTVAIGSGAGVVILLLAWIGAARRRRST